MSGPIVVKMTTTPAPKSLRPLLDAASFFPFISNGASKRTSCNCIRYWMGCESALEECSSSLFCPTVITIDSEQHDVAISRAKRILDAVEELRHDVQTIQASLLPTSPYEGLEFREQLKECDVLGASILQAKRQRSVWNQHAVQKEEHDRLQAVLPRLELQAEQANEEKIRKGRLLQRKRIRLQVLEEEASSNRRLRNTVERTARRCLQRELDGVSTERLLPRQGASGTLDRINEEEIPSLAKEIQELEHAILSLELTIEEFRSTRDRQRELNACLGQTTPPKVNENNLEADRCRLRELREALIRRNPRMFRLLLEEKAETYIQHEQDFDEFLELIEAGMCTCGKAFADHLILLTPYGRKSDALEKTLREFVNTNEEAADDN